MLFPTIATDKTPSHAPLTPKQKAINGKIANYTNYNNGGVYQFPTFIIGHNSQISRGTQFYSILPKFTTTQARIYIEGKV